MKKKFKKLSLSTETLRNLTEPALQKAAAGVASLDETGCTAPCTLCTRPCHMCTSAGCTLCCM